MDDISKLNVFRTFYLFLLLFNFFINLCDDFLDSVLCEFLFEHFLEYSQNDFELMSFIFGKLHADSKKSPIGKLLDVINKFLVVSI